MRSLLSLPVTAAVAACLIAPSAAGAASLPAQSTAILSGQPSLFEPLPTPVNYSSTGNESVSDTGRYVAFSSDADGLAADDNDDVTNVYVKDMQTGAITFVSRADGATGAPSDASCLDPALSADGSVVAFACEGPLDPVADTNGKTDVYARRIATGETILVSREANKGPVNNLRALHPSVNGDGTYVAFDSTATNLSAAAGADGGSHVYRRHIGGTDEVDLVSVKVTSEGGGPVRGDNPSISDDGKKIAFTHSSGPPPQQGDTNNRADVYVRDLVAGTVDLASRTSTPTGLGDGNADSAAISGDGKSVVFVSTSTNYTALDPDRSPDVYVRLLDSLETKFVSFAGLTKGTKSERPSISSDGRMVAFTSEGKLDPADASETASVYAKNVGSPSITLVSRGDGDTGASATAEATFVSVSGDGKKFAFALNSGLVVPGADPRHGVVALRDISATPETTRLVSRPAGTDPFVSQGGITPVTTLSDDGRYAAMLTSAPGLGAPPMVQWAVVVRDRVTGETTVASREDGPNGAYLPAIDRIAVISGDGHRVAFVVDRGSSYEVWVRDVVTNKSWLASRADGPAGTPANGGADSPHLDFDGSRVVFTSLATNLSPDDTDGRPDAYVRDLDTDKTQLVSRASGPAGAKSNAGSDAKDISGDGQRVLFLSGATNLGDPDLSPDAYVRDLDASTTTLVGIAPDGTKPNAPVDNAAFDASGNRLVFETQATNLLGATGPLSKLFVRDIAANTLILASRNGLDGAPYDGPATGPEISPDGSYITFLAQASGLPGATPDFAMGYLRDLSTGRVELVTRRGGADGAPVTAAPGEPLSVSAGGGCVSFAVVEDLFGKHVDFVQTYLRAVRADCSPVDPPEPDGPRGDGNGGGGNGPGGDGADGRDTVAPKLTAAKLTRKRIKTGKRTALTFRSSEPATLALTFERVRGKRVKKAAASSVRIKAGAGRIKLTSKVGRKKLAPGKYRITLVARDAAGNASKPVRLTLTIVRKG